MLEGVVKFPPEFAQRYRDKGYWQDKSLAEEFAAVFERYAQRIALIDGDREYAYADVDRLSDHLALNLLDLGLKPLDRVVLVAAERRRVRDPLLRAAEDRRDPDRRARHPPLRGDQPVRPDRPGRRCCLSRAAERLRIRADGRARAGGKPVPAALRRPRRACRRAVVELIAPARSGGRAGENPHRPDRSVHLPALRRHHRHAEADPAHAQRLRLQLQDRGVGLRRDGRLGAAARAADRAQPAARLPRHPGLLLQRRQGGAEPDDSRPRKCSRWSSSTA